MESASNADLLVDVIHEILLRLPVKTLMRFKCVCKNWYALIGSPTFVNQHFSHKSNPDCLLIPRYIPEEKHLTYALYADELGSGYQEPDYIQFPDKATYLMGPLRGVFCVGKSGHIALFNPAMRQFRPVPSHDLEGNEVYDYVAGFGLDPLSGDYSVVTIPHLSNSSTGLVCIYNSGSDSWRRIEDLGLATKIKKNRCRNYTCLDGVIYWLTYGVDVAIVLALDSSDNNQEIQVPDCFKYPSYSSVCKLDLYGDSIALMSCDLRGANQGVNVWVMKEVGCWTRIFTLGRIEGLDWPICLWKKSEIILQTIDATSLTLCNVATGILRMIEVPGRRRGKVLLYRESLVSIKIERGSCMLWDTSSRFVQDWFGQN